MKNLSHVIGKVFGQLTILEEVTSKIAGHRAFLTKCSCGRMHTVLWNNISKGNTTRCPECAKASRIAASTKNGATTNVAEYNSYRAMVLRCLSPKQISYPRYGGSGIEICTEWLPENNGFVAFLEDMGTRLEGTTLDRIDNNKGYSKDNCRWASVSVQNHNKSKRNDAKTSEYIGVSVDGRVFVVQLVANGKKFTGRFIVEEDAAIYYDNLSEDFYGDRPNKTVRREVESRSYKRGSIVQDKKSLSWRVRLTLPDGTRKSLGSYKELSKAEEVLQTEYEKYYE